MVFVAEEERKHHVLSFHFLTGVVLCERWGVGVCQRKGGLPSLRATTMVESIVIGIAMQKCCRFGTAYVS